MANTAFFFDDIFAAAKGVAQAEAGLFLANIASRGYMASAEASAAVATAQTALATSRVRLLVAEAASQSAIEELYRAADSVLIINEKVLRGGPGGDGRRAVLSTMICITLELLGNGLAALRVDVNRHQVHSAAVHYLTDGAQRGTPAALTRGAALAAAAYFAYVLPERSAAFAASFSSTSTSSSSSTSLSSSTADTDCIRLPVHQQLPVMVYPSLRQAIGRVEVALEMLRQAVENQAAANSNQGAAAEAETEAEDGGEVAEGRRRPGELRGSG